MISAASIPTLHGEENFDEWQDLLVKYLRVNRLAHVLEGRGSVRKTIPDHEPDVIKRAATGPAIPTATTTSQDYDPDDGYIELSGDQIDAAATKFGLTSLGFLDELKRMHFEARNDPAAHPAATDASSRFLDNASTHGQNDELDRDLVLFILATSVSPVRDWLALQGWDAAEADPARYYQSVVDCYARLARVNSKDELKNLRSIHTGLFDTIRAYQEQLVSYRRRMFLAGHFQGEKGETQMLWHAVDGLRRQYPEIHARLAADMLVKDGKPEKLSWTRLMVQLAHMHERKVAKKTIVYCLTPGLA